MLKARLGNMVVIGLTARNVELLKEGKPIAFDGAPFGLPDIQVLVMYGETEQVMMAEIESHMNGQRH